MEYYVYFLMGVELFNIIFGESEYIFKHTTKTKVITFLILLPIYGRILGWF